MAGKQQNHYLNYWKGIACFGVLFFHTRFPLYELDGVLQTMFRFAVPLFFMVSGYFCYGEDTQLLETKLPAKIKRIFWINLGGCTYYFLMQLAIALLGNSHGSMEDVTERFQMMFNTETMINWLVFNQDPFVHIMWFTSALLYCYLLFWIINHFNLYRLAYGFIPVFIGIHFLVGNIFVLFGVETDKIYYRNFILFGLPFFMLGNWLRKNKTDIMEKITVKKCRMALGTGLVLGVAEWFLMGRREMYFGTLLVVVGMYMLTMHYPERKEKNVLTIIGAKYSLFVYVIHYSVIIVLERVMEGITTSDSTLYYVYGFAKPFLVFGICVVGGWVFYKILDMLKKK